MKHTTKFILLKKRKKSENASKRRLIILILGDSDNNHPSGEINPSAEDRAITLQMTEAGKLLGIPVLDHVIVNTEPEGDLFEPKIRFYSFAEKGLIKP